MQLHRNQTMNDIEKSNQLTACMMEHSSIASMPRLLHDGLDDQSVAYNHEENTIPSHSATQLHGSRVQPSLPTAADAAADPDNEASPIYKYRDFGHVDNDGDDGASDGNLGQSGNIRSSSESSIRVQKFPVKLYAILAQKEFHDIICWMPHGRSWKVLKPSLFESLVMPLFFEYSNYHSFNRLVNAWSFRRISSGPDRGSYYHELFLRGMPHLQKYMRRLPKTHKKLPMKKKDEPDFYSLDQSNPLPKVHEAPIPGAAATVQAMRAQGCIITPDGGMSPMPQQQLQQQYGNNTTVVTPNVSPLHSQNFIGGPAMNSNGMVGNNGTNMGYIANNGNNMNYMNSGMNTGSIMQNGGFAQQGMGMMGVSSNYQMGNMMGGMPNKTNMMGGISNNGMASMGGNTTGMVGQQGIGGNSYAAMSNGRYHEMGGQDEYNTMQMMGSQQQAFAMNALNSQGTNMNGNGYGGVNYGGISSNYNSVPSSHSNMRRPGPGPMGQQGGMDLMQHGVDQTPKYTQQDMFSGFPQQGMPSSINNNFKIQHQHNQFGIYGGGSGVSSNNGYMYNQDDYGQGSAQDSGMQQQQRKRPSSS